MSISLKAAEIRRIDLAAGLPYVFVPADFEIDGIVQRGTSADSLQVDFEIEAQLAAIHEAVDFAKEIAAENVFKFWIQLHEAMEAWGVATDHSPVLAHVATTLIERSLIDAYCRAKGTTFASALHANAFGIELGALRPYLKSRQPAELLGKPLERLTLRHAVGVNDPLTDADIPEKEKSTTELSKSLEASIRFYGLEHFSLQLSGVLDADLSRLREIAAIITHACGRGYAFSLDGCESFTCAQELLVFWEAIEADPALKPFFKKLLYIEQPFHREMAFDNSVLGLFAEWPKRPPIIIDESDDTLNGLPRALDWGYAGTTHRNSRGVIKGVANRCLLNALKAREPIGKYMKAASSHASIGPVDLLQDLTVQACLGNSSVELSAYDAYHGMSLFPKPLQQSVLKSHGDLYAATSESAPHLVARDGQFAVGSLLDAPFGYSCELPLDSLTAI